MKVKIVTFAAVFSLMLMTAATQESAASRRNAARRGTVIRDASGWTPAPRVRQGGAPVVSLDPDSLDFGDQVVKKGSPPKRITLTNTGNKDLYVNSVSLDAEEEWQEYAIAGDTCTGATVAANKSCVVDIRFTPADTGDRNATLRLKDSAVDSPQSVTLTGNGINSIDVPPFEARMR